MENQKLGNLPRTGPPHKEAIAGRVTYYDPNVSPLSALVRGISRFERAKPILELLYGSVQQIPPEVIAAYGDERNFK
jgi:hypothetical protein